jgi:hypothetical protein
MLDSMSAQMHLLEAYQQGYGIFNHDDPDPEVTHLDLFGYHPKEDYVTHSREAHLMRRYALLKVGDKLKLDWLQFIAQPRDVVERQLTLCEELLNSDTVTGADLNRFLKNT